MKLLTVAQLLKINPALPPTFPSTLSEIDIFLKKLPQSLIKTSAIFDTPYAVVGKVTVIKLLRYVTSYFFK